MLGGGLTVAAFGVEIKAAATGTARAEEAASASVVLEISRVGARAACGGVWTRTAYAGRSVADLTRGGSVGAASATTAEAAEARPPGAAVGRAKGIAGGRDPPTPAVTSNEAASAATAATADTQIVENGTAGTAAAAAAAQTSA